MREKAYGGAPTFGAHPSEGGSSGRVIVYGGAPTFKDGLSHRGEKQRNRSGGEVFPRGFGGAPTFKDRKSPRGTRGVGGGALPTGTIP